MPKPPIAACGHEPLYVCSRCGKCCDCDKCPPPMPELVSVNSRKAAEAIRTAMREREESARLNRDKLA